MNFSQMIVGAVVVIAVTTICQTEGIPKPQKFVAVDGFSFKGPVDRSEPLQSTNGPPLVEPVSTPPFTMSTLSPTIATAVPVSTPSPNTLTPAPETPAVDPTLTQPVTQNPALVQCTQNCQFRVTSEFNPVCGSDRSVYMNPGMLNCFKACGHDVDHAYFGPCISQIRG